MKILMISSYYLPYLAGAELYIKEIAERLVKNGNKVAVLTKRLGNLEGFEVINNVKVYRVRSLNIPQLRSFFALPGLLFKGIRMARQADLIHAHITYPNGIVAYLIGKITGKNYILTLQGDELMDYPEKRLLKLLKWPIGTALRNAEKVHCISNALADNVISYFNVDRKKISIIPNGVDLDLFEKTEKINIRNKGEKIVVSVSRLSEKNNIEALIKAFKYVDKNVRLIVIGDGPEKDKLSRLKKQLNVKVDLIGNIEHNKIAGYLKVADVFIRVPKTEGLGIVFLEAMAAGLPIIASNVGGIPDIVKDNVNGLLVNNDEREIADAINRMIKDKRLRNKLANNGKRFVRDYDWDNVYKKTIRLYEN